MPDATTWEFDAIILGLSVGVPAALLIGAMIMEWIFPVIPIWNREGRINKHAGHYCRFSRRWRDAATEHSEVR
jgi:hypothetical protein